MTAETEPREDHAPARPATEQVDPAHAHVVPAFLQLQWHITHRCNLRCRHCYQHDYRGTELTWDQKLHVLDDFQTLLAMRTPLPAQGRITITGGEPMLCDELFPLCEEIAARSLRFALLTNGTQIDSDGARRLAKLHPDYVQVSVEGDETTHDQIRGTGSFRQAAAGLQALVRAGVKTSMAFTAHRRNYREFPAVVRFARKLGVDRVWADRLIPEGTAEHTELQTLDADETRAFFEIMRASRPGFLARRLSPTRVSMHRALQFLVGGGRPYRCTAGRSLLALLPDGDLLPCRRLPVRVGNVLQTPMSRLFFEHPLLRQLREPGRIAEGCAKCMFRMACGGGLRCLAHSATGDAFNRDPGCWLKG